MSMKTTGTRFKLHIISVDGTQDMPFITEYCYIYSYIYI